jgi:SAM-dependent methyltransferase
MGGMEISPVLLNLMANFQPLKKYMFYCLDKCIEMQGLKPPFLDIGCGIGDVSLQLAKKGWSGMAIDYSDIAVERARNTLKNFPKVEVKKAELLHMEGSFHTIILWDVLEHIEHDQEALTKIGTLLAPGGHVLIAVPSNPREWRWDDQFYGHFRRYTKEDMSAKLQNAQITPVLFWDFTYPIFWILRRMYTLIKRPPAVDEENKEERTKESSTVNAWDIPVISWLLNHSSFVWRMVYAVQFHMFRNATSRGHEFFALGKRQS